MDVRVDIIEHALEGHSSGISVLIPAGMVRASVTALANAVDQINRKKLGGNV